MMYNCVWFGYFGSVVWCGLWWFSVAYVFLGRLYLIYIVGLCGICVVFVWDLCVIIDILCGFMWGCRKFNRSIVSF